MHGSERREREELAKVAKDGGNAALPPASDAARRYGPFEAESMVSSEACLKTCLW